MLSRIWIKQDIRPTDPIPGEKRCLCVMIRKVILPVKIYYIEKKEFKSMVGDSRYELAVSSNSPTTQAGEPDR